MARFEACIWKCHPYRGQELLSCTSASVEEYALEAAGRYAEGLAAQGWELEMQELPDGTRRVRAAKDGEERLVTVETREQ